jgi:uncharacterized protein (TIGR00290 family)
VTEPVVLAWSGGKDSARALLALRQDPRWEVVALLTTVTQDYGRVSMHGIRRAVVEAQAVEVGLPLEEVPITAGGDDESYSLAMASALGRLGGRYAGLRTVAFGDLFLEDVRSWREERLARAGWRGTFPLWGRNTADLAEEVLALGFRTTVCCVDTQQLPIGFAGREYDLTLLADLPPGVDPCAERGEFHTCVHAGPIFRRPLLLTKGEVVLRDGRFGFCDLFLADGPEAGGREQGGDISF